MRIPRYYCSHCGKFKKWYQTYLPDVYSSDICCRHCDRVVKDTEEIFESFIQDTIEREKSK